MTTISIIAPRAVPVPRAAPVAAALFDALLHIFERGHSAPDAETKAEAEQAQRVAQASAVRRLAETLGEHDPRCVADLQAAADRHERGD